MKAIPTWREQCDEATSLGAQLVLMQAEIDALRTRLAEVEKDAARYRWMRSAETEVALVIDKVSGFIPPDEQVPGVGGYHTYEYRSGEELDMAIDDAMGAQA